MKIKNLKCTTFLLAGIFMLQSCSKDDDFIDDIDSPDIDVELTDETTELIIEWSNLWVSIDQFTEGMRPNTITRSLAYIHLTGYETAVPFMDNYSSNTDRFNNLNINTNTLEDNVDLELALNTAYALAIDHFMINLETGVRQRISDFQEEKEIELTEGLSEDEIENSELGGDMLHKE